jgi:Holliday junction DNA helicase RuvB
MAGLNDIFGLNEIKKVARTDIDACLQMSVDDPEGVFDHTLVHGPQGTGKTFLARKVSEELGYHFADVQCDTLNNRNDLVDFMVTAQAQARSLGLTLLIFLDEIHELPKSVQEALYYPMLERRIKTADGYVTFEPFTLMVATTHLSDLQPAFVSRFQNQWEIKPYDDLTIRTVVDRYFASHDVICTAQAGIAIAKRSRGLPRQALNIARRTRKILVGRREDVAHERDVMAACELEGLDDKGLSGTHHDVLKYLYEAQGDPRALRTISMSIRQRQETVENVIEPHLLHLGFIEITSQGRKLTDKGYKHLATLCLAD